MIKTITIIGCGAMGSHIATSIVRDPDWDGTLILIDFDRYEPDNLANQAVSWNAIGRLKVEGLKFELLRIRPDATINCINLKLDSTLHVRSALSGLVVMCVDTMRARSDIMFNLLQANPRVQYVVETRVDAGAGVSHAFNPNSRNQCDCWWMYWHSDADTEDRLGCNQRSPIHHAILHTTAMASSQINKVLHHYAYELGIEENRMWMDFDLRKQGWETWPLDKPE